MSPTSPKAIGDPVEPIEVTAYRCAACGGFFSTLENYQNHAPGCFKRIHRDEMVKELKNLKQGQGWILANETQLAEPVLDLIEYQYEPDNAKTPAGVTALTVRFTRTVTIERRYLRDT